MHVTPLIASGDELIKLIIFVIIAAVYGFGKLLQKGQPEMPEELPRPRPPAPAPPRRPPVASPPVVIQRQYPSQQPSGRRELTEDQVQEVLRRMRVPPQRQVPPPRPPVVETVEPEARRLVKLHREEPELPSTHPELTPHEVELPSIHPAETARETRPPSAQPPKTAAQQPPDVAVAARASAYRAQLRNRIDVRRAIVLRELLGPPLALRQDW